MTTTDKGRAWPLQIREGHMATPDKRRAWRLRIKGGHGYCRYVEGMATADTGRAWLLQIRGGQGYCMVWSLWSSGKGLEAYGRVGRGLKLMVEW